MRDISTVYHTMLDNLWPVGVCHIFNLPQRTHDFLEKKKYLVGNVCFAFHWNVNIKLLSKTRRTDWYINTWGCWPTSRCRRMESIVSLERRVCSCAKLQVFSCYRSWKEACQATSAISTTSRRELSSSIFFSCKARRPRKFTPFWKKH